MTPPSKRGLALLLLLVLVGTGGSLAYWRHRDVAGVVNEAAAPIAAASAGYMASNSGTAVGSSRARVAAPAPSLAIEAEAATSGEMDIPPEGFEFCGVRRVPANELRRWKADPVWGKTQLQQIEDQRERISAAGLARISARLAAGNDRQQVAARLLMQDRDGAALLAERSTDAQAYQMALTACAWPRRDTPNCARLNPGRWAQLDPLDARPWMRMMQAAQSRKDQAAVDSALAQAAARPGLSRGSFLLEALAVAAADAVPDAAELGQALAVVIGIDAAMPGFDMGAPGRACRGEALNDATRLAHCRTVARQALASATDLGDAQMAQKLADRTGVPPNQQAYDAVTLKAAEERFHARALDLDVDCESMRRLKQLSAERAASGDLAMAMALLPPRAPAR
ncbi:MULTISPECIES: hypothetical protein [unclassified Roseateles]|uniref:hypothetical protein n=1 Tax=unclassified Roseateles TaxID=2626991 RepID=UPI0012E3E10F|nr:MULTISPECIES: hypothetical protein [unclassified Roseateles]